MFEYFTYNLAWVVNDSWNPTCQKLQISTYDSRIPIIFIDKKMKLQYLNIELRDFDIEPRDFDFHK